MKYLYNTKIEAMTNSIKNKFVVSIFNAEKTAARATKWSAPTICDYYIMDNLGRIYDFKIDNLDFSFDEERNDEFFEVQIDGVKYLFDDNMKVAIYGYKKISDFSKEGIAVLTKNDDTQILVKKDGSVFCDKYLLYAGFENGLCMVKLDSGKFGFIDEDLNELPNEFEDVVPFVNKDYTWYKDESGEYVIDRNFEIVGGPFQNILIINDDNIVITLLDEGKRCQFFDVSGREIFENAREVKDSTSGVIRIETHDSKVQYYDKETGKQIGGDFKLSSGQFYGDMCPVVVGENEDGFLWTVLKKDGSMFRKRYGAVTMLDDKHVAVFDDNSQCDNDAKYFIVDENEKIVTQKTFRRIDPFVDGVALVEKSNKKWSYLNTDFETIKDTLKKANTFNCGFGVVIKKSGSVDAVDSFGILLSEISMFAEKIDKNPKAFLDLPEEFFGDTTLITNLYNLAIRNIERLINETTNLDESNQLKFLAAEIEKYFAKVIQESAKQKKFE